MQSTTSPATPAGASPIPRHETVVTNLNNARMMLVGCREGLGPITDLLDASDILEQTAAWPGVASATADRVRWSMRQLVSMAQGIEPLDGLYIVERVLSGVHEELRAQFGTGGVVK